MSNVNQAAPFSFQRVARQAPLSDKTREVVRNNILQFYVKNTAEETEVLDGELRETQTTDYFSKHRRSDCAVRELTAR